jgi:hypothetical protein
MQEILAENVRKAEAAIKDPNFYSLGQLKVMEQRLIEQIGLI